MSQELQDRFAKLIKTTPLESETQRDIMLAAPDVGARLHRNNVGVLKDQRGQYVRYGVGGDGGSDLIGPTMLEITPDMVGRRVAIFTAVEVKRKGKKPTVEQEAFLEYVRQAGGIAVLAYSVQEFTDAVNAYRTGRSTG